MTNYSEFLKKVFSDIGQRSAYSQMLIGVTSGWATGFTTMKIGKFAAFAVGGSIILLEIAHQEGLIKINWTKLDKSVDKLADKVEASLGREKNWKDKTERYVDNQLDRAESLLTRNGKKVAKWYTKLIGDEEGPKVNDLHIFLASFFGGVALGIATG
ncbi:FUN14 domain-containing protein 2 [Drosophila suzukii]|uniref:FUN14 domain-containing protein 2 n=1 Tax=Drosophila suzukii TaxID=28584 RepID=A0AB39ZZ96_DROSZ|nr:FUN14 domain-containing protein 2 [Drosophila suzukii]XP_016966049.1 FUN14 domain-containing protein 2 [Drosophila biarmipes]XP_037712054.1 FUN14 domain-containing protein 2 [Drosophila subpulchrella]